MGIGPRKPSERTACKIQIIRPDPSVTCVEPRLPTLREEAMVKSVVLVSWCNAFTTRLDRLGADQNLDDRLYSNTP